MTIRKWYKIDCPCGVTAEIFDVRNKEALRAFRNAGWRIGPGQENDLCPSCKKSNPLLAMPTGVDFDIAQVAALTGLTFTEATIKLAAQHAAGTVEFVSDGRSIRPRYRRLLS